MSGEFSYRLCAACATVSQDVGDCAVCGSATMLEVTNGYLLAFPAGTLACAGCGSDERPVRFRGWSRLVSFVWWARDARLSAYVCEDCARRETAKSLFLTALLGWLSVPSWFFYGWRSTYLNWRAIWAPPPRPHEWGAMSAHDLMEALRQAQEEAFEELDEAVIAGSPLGQLDDMQQRLVLSADGLYELLGVRPDATVEEIRGAYRRRSKEVHPDLNGTTPASAEEMVRLNQAWEILRDDHMRAAYDWTEANLERAA